MQYYSSYAFILLLLHQGLAQDEIDEVTHKKTKNAVDEVLHKIKEFSTHSFSNAPYSSKLEMLKKVEEKLKKAGKSLGAKGERYIKLIMKGIKARTFSQISDSNLTKTQVELPINSSNDVKFQEKTHILNNNLITKLSNISSNYTKMSYDLSKTEENLNLGQEIDKGKNRDDIKGNIHFKLSEDLRRKNIDSNESVEKYSDGIGVIETSTDRVIQSFTPSYKCDGSLNLICLNIKQMRQLKCQFGDSSIRIEKLCDGYSDCPYKTDEKYCTSQVTERIHNANQVLHQTDEFIQLGCFSNKTKKSIMTSQIIILRNILQAQHEFVQKYKYFNWTLIPNSEPLQGDGNVKRAVGEISLLISTLGLALDAELCSHRDITGNQFTARKFNDLLVEDYDKLMDEVAWPPKSCVCKDGRCENVTMCTNDCMRVCWQKHSLTRWACPAINKTENIPLSVICDGKFDCFDESDEKGCVTGITFAKFEAYEIFKDIFNLLSSKIASKEYEFLRNLFISLRGNIEELQKFCMASKIDLKTIRTLRNKCFFALSTVYWETIIKSSFDYQASEIYLFLLSLNEKIVDALKLSHTGNKRVISNDGCHCRDGRCNMPVCSMNCLRSCVAEPWLTRYFCKDTVNNSIPLEDICNGKPNCPNEDDEANCQKDICRRHHLTLIRRSLEKIGKKQAGTSMGELLASWKTKVSSTLVIAESDDRPKSNIIRDVIRRMLNDLVLTYGAVKDYRRDNEYALEEFTSIARFIMNFLKTCGH